MKIADHPERFTWFFRLAGFVLIVFVLHAAQEVLLPLALSMLLAFLLTPLVVRLTRWGLPRTAAILTSVAFAFAVIGSIGWVVTRQTIALVKDLPNYEENLRAKIESLKRPRAPDTVTRVSNMVQNLRTEMQTPSAAEKKQSASDALRNPAGSKEVTPVPVEIRPQESGPLELARDMILPILRPLGLALVVTVFLIAMLFQREDLRDRFIRVVSAGKITVATQAIDDAAARVSRYLGMQLIVNAIYGVPIGVGLFLLGVPNALLWGLLAAILRFIPFVGPWIGAAFPVTVTVAVDPGWTMLAYTLGIFVVMEIAVFYFVEPVLYGASTGVSKLALLVAAVFWTWLWGPLGLVLSTPITVCALVLGSYVPALHFLRTILGSEPVLEPAAQFYQRMLSMEADDMLDLASKFVTEHSLEEFYEQLFVPALLLCEEDRHNGALPEVRQRFIFQSSRDLIEELERRDETSRLEATEGVAVEKPAATMPAPPAVLGIPARDEADEIVALMLSHLLRRRGIPAGVITRHSGNDDVMAALERRNVKAIFISSLPPSAVASARQMCRRIRNRFPKTPLMVGLWQHHAGVSELSDRLQGVQPDVVAITLQDAVGMMEGTVVSAPPFPAAAMRSENPPKLAASAS